MGSDFVLGLDLGPNSCGWALVEARVSPEGGKASHEPLGFLDTSAAGHPPVGVRVFEAGLHNLGSSKEKSLCQTRREARSMRRNHARRNARRRTARHLLVSAGLLPDESGQGHPVWSQCPYELRARALDEALEPFELGRALYHLAQRRGFKSNRKSGTPDEDKGMLGKIGELSHRIQDAGARTLGEFLSSELKGTDPRAPEASRVRARHTRRDMYEREFKALIEAQRLHHTALTDDFVERLRKALFFQHSFELTEERRARAPSRANLHRAPSLRPCPLEPSERRAPIGLWEAQRFRLLKDISSLRVSESFGLERDLKPDERNVLLEMLSVREKVSFDQIRKELHKRTGLDPEARFNLERGYRSRLDGNLIDTKLANALGKRAWKELTEDGRGALRDVLLAVEDHGKARRQLITAGVPELKAEKLAHWTPPDRFLSYSLVALRKLLPHMEDGKDETQAIAAAYPNRPGRFRELGGRA